MFGATNLRQPNFTQPLVVMVEIIRRSVSIVEYFCTPSYFDKCRPDKAREMQAISPKKVKWVGLYRIRMIISGNRGLTHSRAKEDFFIL